LRCLDALACSLIEDCCSDRNLQCATSLLWQRLERSRAAQLRTACIKRRQVAETCAACLAVEARRHPTENARTAAMQDVVMWLCGNDPLGAGLPISDAGSSTVSGLFASLEGLARGDAALVGA